MTHPKVASLLKEESTDLAHYHFSKKTGDVSEPWAVWVRAIAALLTLPPRWLPHKTGLDPDRERLILTFFAPEWSGAFALLFEEV
ncbi:MAG: hypothetical protein ACFB12_15845 [Leptolyngbyaceae cyanobacterium]